MPRKKKKNYYFTQVHEDAIAEYILSEDHSHRSDLYVKVIGPALNEMVDKIIYTYKFTTLPNIDSLRDECKIWLTTVIDKYDPNKGSKAFSYFSVITKNWFIHKVKKNSKKTRIEVGFEELPKELEMIHMSAQNTYIEDRENREFMSLLKREMDSWDTGKLKENEKKVLEAVKILMTTSDDIEIFNKKAIYLYIREITGLKTKQVVNNLNKMRSRYKIFVRRWHEGNIR